MTDKQIIIDGIDASGCTRYCSDTGKCTAFKSQYLCSERNNCYTKRILKKNETINILKEKLLCKEQECEELKRLIAKQKNAKIQLSKLKDKQYKEFCDMKQTLTEIKEIAEQISLPMGTEKSSNRVILANQILQKISECEVGND